MSTATSPRATKLTALDLLCSLLTPKGRTISIPSGQAGTHDLQIDMTDKRADFSGDLRKSNLWHKSREKTLTKSLKSRDIPLSKTSLQKRNLTCPSDALISINSRMSNIQNTSPSKSSSIKEGVGKLAQSKSFVRIFSVQKKLSILKRNKLIMKISQTYNEENRDSQQNTRAKGTAIHDFRLVPVKRDSADTRSLSKLSNSDSSKLVENNRKSSRSELGTRRTLHGKSAIDRDYDNKTYESLARNVYNAGTRENTAPSLKTMKTMKLLDHNLTLQGVPVLRNNLYQLPYKSLEISIKNRENIKPRSVTDVVYGKDQYIKGKISGMNYKANLQYTRDYNKRQDTPLLLNIDSIDTHDSKSNLSSYNHGHPKFNYNHDKNSTSSRSTTTKESITELNIIKTQQCDTASVSSAITSFPEIYSKGEKETHLEVRARSGKLDSDNKSTTNSTLGYDNHIVQETNQRIDKFQQNKKRPFRHLDEYNQHTLSNEYLRIQPTGSNDLERKPLIVSNPQKYRTIKSNDLFKKHQQNINCPQTTSDVEDNECKYEYVNSEQQGKHSETEEINEDVDVLSGISSPNVFLSDRQSPPLSTISADTGRDDISNTEKIKDCDSTDSSDANEPHEESVEAPKFYGSTSLLSDLNSPIDRGKIDENGKFKMLRAIDQGAYSDFAHRKYRKKHSQIKPREGKSVHYLKVKMKDK